MRKIKCNFICFLQVIFQCFISVFYWCVCLFLFFWLQTICCLWSDLLGSLLIIWPICLRLSDSLTWCRGNESPLTATTHELPHCVWIFHFSQYPTERITPRSQSLISSGNTEYLHICTTNRSQICDNAKLGLCAAQVVRKCADGSEPARPQLLDTQMEKWGWLVCSERPRRKRRNKSRCPFGLCKALSTALW